MTYLKKESLRPYTYYLGSGRGSDVGYWDGAVFHIFREKFSRADSTSCSHWDDGGPFVPMREIVSPWSGVAQSGHATTEEILKKLEEDPSPGSLSLDWPKIWGQYSHHEKSRECWEQRKRLIQDLVKAAILEARNDPR